ncbi:hypothetical protein HOY39_04770 [Neisseria meningitidis]|nr:hypothetical protein [Neisseria meningitidis]
MLFFEKTVYGTYFKTTEYKGRLKTKQYSGLNLNQYSVASPCRIICTVCGFVALS